MGEVYRARDGRIGRDVALKVLTAERVADAEAHRRFEQEARAAGQLALENVMAVYDVGVHEGTSYVVCELLEGATLRERLAAGPLPPRRATEVALGVARGLAAAHGKGIVHRDLKPENLFLNREGRVKILDFGLAKLRDDPALLAGGPRAGEEAHAPTAPLRTGPGVVMGTVGYMSPEQVRGQTADARSEAGRPAAGAARARSTSASAGVSPAGSISSDAGTPGWAHGIVAPTQARPRRAAR